MLDPTMRYNESTLRHGLARFRDPDARNGQGHPPWYKDLSGGVCVELLGPAKLGKGSSRMVGGWPLGGAVGNAPTRSTCNRNGHPGRGLASDGLGRKIHSRPPSSPSRHRLVCLLSRTRNSPSSSTRSKLGRGIVIGVVPGARGQAGVASGSRSQIPRFLLTKCRGCLVIIGTDLPFSPPGERESASGEDQTRSSSCRARPGEGGATDR